jgi:hypothetical protein
MQNPQATRTGQVRVKRAGATSIPVVGLDSNVALRPDPIAPALPGRTPLHWTGY